MYFKGFRHGVIELEDHRASFELHPEESSTDLFIGITFCMVDWLFLFIYATRKITNRCVLELKS